MHVTGVAVLALVYMGASCSFVSAKFAAMTKLHIDCDVPMAMQLQTGRSDATNCVIHCKLLIENVIYAKTFYVLDMSLPMIIGLDFC